MANESKGRGQGKALENFIIGTGKLCLAILQVAWHGIDRKIVRNVDRVLWLLVAYGILFVLVFWNWRHLAILHWTLPNVFSERVLSFFVHHVSQMAQFLTLSGLMTVLLGVLVGARHFFRMRGYQKELKHLGLKSAAGLEPKVIDVEKQDAFHSKITLASRGVGIDNYKSRKSDLESIFGAIVEDVRVSERSRKLVEIFLVEKELTTHVGYEKCANMLTEPYSFLIGESLGGILAQSIRSLPHLMIAGTSGNGKSVFFNQALISMMKTSPHIQLILLDLKLGVEVRAYGDLPNSRIAKNAAEAVALLKAVVDEMKARFKFLEEKGYKQIDPERDGKDLILVGVDEASVLYGKRRGDRSGNEMINLARDLTDEVAKLGRAACIHLIVATQKVTNESIDTKIQENIGGRICFRVNSLQGSNTVLGNKKAYELPDVKGRAIWACGNDFTEVQTPFVSEAFINSTLKEIKAEFEQGKRKCLQPPLAASKLAGKESAASEFFSEKKT